MKLADVDKFADGLVGGITAYVQRATAPLKERIAALEQRLAALESQPKSLYRGVWNATEDYASGDQCTVAGSLWIATTASRGTKPGTGTCWRLAVKKGRAA